MAQELGITPGQLALAWILHQPGITSVITGATSVAQVAENIVADGVRLDDATQSRLNAIFPA
jgi:aryl-alcohol dehydrogenase-like predicted oxidoreductase